ncbi:hypothetical protein FOYG_10086 [Fusarium oxysporum NRRL 32931]|uniref:Uncharacterized protein n=1 Tax=Fusarium oxysporum NRRL 32931 TaxID=660029 RepID=W9I770_FUSOX|nr:hypothetical protein FOYG_10086 [Fusarium oxysporum NRRL 32931]
MYRLLSPKKRPDREVEACCILSKDVDTPGPKKLGSSPRGLQTVTGSILRRLGQNYLDAARPKHGREHRAHSKAKVCLPESNLGA